MDNTGSPKGGSYEPPVVLFGSKTRVIGRIPSQAALIVDMPLTGSLSRREGSNDGHVGQLEPAKKVTSPEDEQVHSPAQTSFRQSEAPSPTFSPETNKDGGASKQTDRPPHQTSFPQSDPPEQAPSASANHQPPGSHPTQNPRPQTQSFTDIQHSHDHSKTDAPVFSKSQDRAPFTIQSFSTSVNHQTPDPHTILNPQTQSISDNQLSHRHSKTDKPFVPKSQDHTLFSTQSSPTFTTVFTSVSKFHPHGTSLPPSSRSAFNTASSDSVSMTNPSVSKASPTKSVVGPNRHNGGKISRIHAKPVTSSIASTTTKNQPPEIPSPIFRSVSSFLSSTAANTKHSHPTLGPGPAHNPKGSRSTSQSNPFPVTRDPQPIHSSHIPPVPQHTPDHQTVPLESQVVPTSQTSTRAPPRPLIPLPKHISKANPVTTATTPTPRPDKTQPNTVLQPLPFSNVPSPQAKPAVLPTNTIPEPSSPPTGPVPTNASVPGTETVIAGADLSSTTGVSAKELLKPALAGSAPAQSSNNIISSTIISQGQPPSVVNSVIVSEGSETASATRKSHHSPSTSDVGRTSASNNSASIIGGVLGAIIGLLVIGFVVVGFCFYRRKLRKVQNKLQLYEKNEDGAPPHYAPQSFGPQGGYEAHATYSQPVIPGNQGVDSAQSLPVVINPFSNATYATEQMHDGRHGFEGPEIQTRAAPGYTKSTNPFTNLALPYQYQANAGHQGLALEKDEKPVEYPNSGLPQYPVEKQMTEYEYWTALHGKPPHKAFDAHLSKLSSATTLSVGTAYTGKRSSASTCINDPDESFGDVEFDSLKMVKPRTVDAVGVAM